MVYFNISSWLARAHKFRGIARAKIIREIERSAPTSAGSAGLKSPLLSFSRFLSPSRQDYVILVVA